MAALARRAWLNSYDRRRTSPIDLWHTTADLARIIHHDVERDQAA
jgi:hypothetical protein